MKAKMIYRFLNYSLVRIVLGLVLSFAVFVITQQLVGKLLDFTSINNSFRNLIKGLIATRIVILAYTLFYGKIENREVKELSGKEALKSTGLGLLIGTSIQALTVFVIYLLGDLQITSVNSVSFIITPLAIAISVSVFEEILLRGIIFRIAEEKLGSIVALLLSALIFGGVHSMNPGSSLISSLCTGIVGFIFGAAYIYSRSLWLPIAIHFSWNFVQSGIFGAITSGNEKTSSLFITDISGAEMITGGSFGPEGTIQAVLLWLIVAIAITTLIVKQNKMIKPFWKSPKTL